MCWILIIQRLITIYIIVNGITSTKGFNHAAGKPVASSSYRADYLQSPDKMVDNCYNRADKTSQCCFASEEENDPWINLDLLALVKISEINVYGFLCPGRLLFLQCMESFPLWIKLSQDHQDLSEYNESYFTRYTLVPEMYEEGILRVTFPSPITARYVGLKKFNEDTARTMIVCEMEVFGECEDPTAREDCMYTCHCLNGTCDGPGGSCWSECEDGWYGDRCITQCQTGFYGRNCVSECPNCVDLACNKTNGHCLNGCNNGWSGDICLDRCENGTWGRGCRKKCDNCQVACDPETGQCSTCLPGWRGASCRKPCKPGFYGYKCEQTCGPCVSICDPTSGFCNEGCLKGWKGNSCEFPCQDTDYDIISCQSPCQHCGNDTCDFATGTCRRPCDAGFIGDNCDVPCPDFRYGENCVHRCGHCLDSAQCSKVDGDCQTGCEPEYTGSQCTEVKQSDRKEEGASSVSVNSSIFVVLPVVGCLIIIMIVSGAFILRRNRKKAMASKMSTHRVARRVPSDKY